VHVWISYRVSLLIHLFMAKLLTISIDDLFHDIFVDVSVLFWCMIRYFLLV
jgi:hypothetical protein